LELIKSDEEAEGETENCQAKNHHYPVNIVKKTMELFMKCGSSFRGIEKTLKLFNDLAETKTPSFSSIRKWLGRMGLYELNREKKYRQDWIFIVDKRIIDKLEWLVDYQPELIRWHQMTVLTRRLETQLKKSGINQKSLNNFQDNKKEKLYFWS
jgi:hypothetical protein